MFEGCLRLTMDDQHRGPPIIPSGGEYPLLSSVMCATAGMQHMHYTSITVSIYLYLIYIYISMQVYIYIWVYIYIIIYTYIIYICIYIYYILCYIYRGYLTKYQKLTGQVWNSTPEDEVRLAGLDGWSLLVPRLFSRRMAGAVDRWWKMSKAGRFHWNDTGFMEDCWNDTLW